MQTVSLTPLPQSHDDPLWISGHRFRYDVSCAACHTVGNAGGADDTSFCANSACHGRDWKFLALDAPRVLELTRPERVTGKGARPVPHPIEAQLDCRRCHDLDKVVPFRAEDAQVANDACGGCHQLPAAPAEGTAPTPAAGVAAVQPPVMPHTLEEREDCLQCHAIDSTVSPTKQDHANYTNSVCQACHKPK